MSHALVLPLILALFFSGHRYATAIKETDNSCFESCPPGFHKSGGCNSASGKASWHKCKICGDNTFTRINNTSDNCERCDLCGNRQETVKNCTRTSNAVCDCVKDYYNTIQNPTDNENYCKTCRIPPGNNENDTDYIRKCKPCQSSECLRKPECRRKYRCEATTRVPTATTTSTATSATFTDATATRSTPLSTASSSKQHGDHVSHFVWLAVVFAVIFGLLLLKKLFGEPERCPYWRTKKDVTAHREDPKFNEQHSHQGNASTTLTIYACEETPMMNLSQSPSTPEHPAPAGTLPPNTDHRSKTARQDEQPKHWPAIVLYAIIKEVPLRRWKEFLRLLSVADEQLERIELETGLGLGSMERQYLMLRLWSQRATASLDDVFTALHYMDLNSCAQTLQENLESLQWRAESKQDFPA